jgi:predicted transglutaminase-like cysteine proteinase
MLRLVRLVSVMTVAVAGLATVSLADAGAAGISATPSSYMRVYTRSEPPSGFLSFCARNGEECRARNDLSDRVVLGPDKWRDLTEVNQVVNRTVKPVSDLDLYGTTEYWTLPSSSGDCEDYVLLKQRMLVERGWPQGSVLVTVVRDEAGQGHAVLTARTSRGDYILDNRFEVIRLWHDTGYSFIKRQSYLSPMIWMSLAPANRLVQPPVASAPQM